MFSLVFRKRLKGTVQQDFQPPFFHHFNLPGPLWVKIFFISQSYSNFSGYHTVFILSSVNLPAVSYCAVNLPTVSWLYFSLQNVPLLLFTILWVFRTRNGRQNEKDLWKSVILCKNLDFHFRIKLLVCFITGTTEQQNLKGELKDLGFLTSISPNPHMQFHLNTVSLHSKMATVYLN